MQIDMHYYGTFALARAAGMAKDQAEIVATTSQFVDDNANSGFIRFLSGQRIDHRATGHHATDLHNLDDKDQRNLWVPFHFLPGNEGTEFTEKLICRENSDVANEMVNRNLQFYDAPYGVELLGITAHVLADTFAHFGFSGVSSRRNRIKDDSFEFFDMSDELKDKLLIKKKTFFSTFRFSLTNIKANIAEIGSGALGHGAAATFPDKPFLSWRYLTQYPGEAVVERKNQESFIRGCKALYDMFSKFLDFRDDLSDSSGKDFHAIEDVVADILSIQADKEDRINAWQLAATRGDLFSEGEFIPNYPLDQWLKSRAEMGKYDPRDLVEQPIYRFFQAAQNHRWYVLRDLLPKYEIIVT